MTKTSKKLLVGFLVCIYLILLLLVAIDNDLYFLITSGRDILNGLFYYNPHANQSIVIQHWLYCVITSVVHDYLGGYIGDIIFVIVQNIILGVLSYKFLIKKIKSSYIACVIPLFLICLNYSFFECTRPHTITIICLLAELLVLEKYKETKNWKHLFKLIPILLLLANTHQAVYLYCGIVALPYMIEGKKFDWKVIISGLLMLPISLCTPYGVDGFIYIFKTIIEDPNKYIYIAEMSPLSYKNFLMYFIIATFIAVVYLNYKHRASKYINYFSLIAIVMTIVNIRGAIIFYIPMLFIMRELNFDILKGKNIIKTRDMAIFFAISFVLAFSMFCDFNRFAFTKIKYTVEFTKAIEQYNIPKDAKIYNTYDIGSILEYEGYNIYVDTRLEVFTDRIKDKHLLLEYGKQPKDIINDNEEMEIFDFMTDEEVLEGTKEFDYIITKRYSQIDCIYEHMNYPSIYSDENFALYKVEKK